MKLLTCSQSNFLIGRYLEIDILGSGESMSWQCLKRTCGGCGMPEQVMSGCAGQALRFIINPRQADA